MTNQAANKQVEAAKQIFRNHNGILKTGEALSQGIHRRTLYAMRDEGVLERLVTVTTGEFIAGELAAAIERTDEPVNTLGRGDAEVEIEIGPEGELAEFVVAVVVEGDHVQTTFWISP